MTSLRAACIPLQPGMAEHRPSLLAVSSQLPWPLDRGGHMRTFHLLRALTRRFAVRLLTAVSPAAQAATGIAALQRAGIAVHPVVLPPRRRFREAARIAAAAVRREPYVLYRRHDRQPIRAALAEQLRRKPPDVYYLDHLDSFQFASALPGVPVVLDCHNVYSQLVERTAHGADRRAARFYLEREARLLEEVEACAARMADMVFTVSVDDARYFASVGARDVQVVPNGVDCAAYSGLPTARRSGPPLLLYIGTMSWPPNASAARFLAAKVLPRVRAAVPDTRLRIIGASPPAEVQALASLPGVEVLDAVSDVTPHLRAAHLLAAPLEAGGGTRLKILEAFAAGLPVVSTAIGCEGLEVTPDEHLLVASGAHFAAAVCSLLADPCRAKTLADNARRLAAQRYDWKVVGDVASTAVAGLLKRRAQRRVVALPMQRAPRPQPIRVLELRSVRGTGGGPEKTILAGAGQHDRQRFDVTVCYLRDARDAVFGIDRRAAQLGVQYCEVRERHSFDPRIWPALRHLVRKLKIDILHAHDYKTDLLAFLLARAERVTPLATAHGWSCHKYRDRLYHIADRRILARLAHVIAVSTPIADALLRAGAASERVHTILNGIDHRYFRRERQREPAVRAALGIAPAAVVVGAIGRLDSGKRFALLVDAVAALRHRHPMLQLLIVGDGEERARLGAHAVRSGLGSACRFLGLHDDVRELHHAFDVFVQSSAYEGTSNAILEAMAMETPIVATDVGGTRQLLTAGEHALLVPAGECGALADAIACTLAEPAAAAARAGAARARVERVLSFDRRMAAVEQLYETVMAERAAIPRRRHR